jgi:hypothetical protein
MSVARRRRTRAFVKWLEHVLYDEDEKRIARIFRVPLRLMGSPRRFRKVSAWVLLLVVVGLGTGTAGAQEYSISPAPIFFIPASSSRIVAQEDAPRTVATGEPVSLTVAMVGTVVVGAGFGLMLHEPGCRCGSDPAWVAGGVAVVAAGVTMTWLGLRSRTVTVAPAISPRVVGVAGTIRWGAPAPRKRTRI